jgi:hypothetical protein
MKEKFLCYVIQLGNNEEVLYVNYSLNVAQSFGRFLGRHTRLKNSKLRAELAIGFEGYQTSRQALRGAYRLIESLERRGFEVIAGGPLLLPYWQTYVIEIEGNPKHVYVGETNYPREKRLQQHIYEFNCGRYLKRFDNLRLADELCDDNVYRAKEASLEAEAALAKSLNLRGYLVEGGH